MSMRIDDGGRGGGGGRRPSGAGGARGTRVAPRAGTRSSLIAPIVPQSPSIGYQGPPSLSAGRTLPSPITDQNITSIRPASGLPSGGGGGGGMGGAVAAAAPAPAAPSISLEDFIQNHFLKRQTENENARALEDFDAESLRMQQETEADMGLRRQDLQRDLDDMGLENAGSFASRGLDRSGLVFQGQDRINEEGQRRGMQIQELLTSLLGQRSQGRIQQQRSGEQLLNQRIAELTRQFNEQNQAPLAV